MLILSCLFLSIGLIYSQNITVSGVVVDDAGIEVVGASVVVKGTTTGVGTDIDGKFSLSAPSNSTLVFSLVGMKKKEMKAAPSMKVVMENDEAMLEEVVVTAIGIQRAERSLGYTLTKVDADQGIQKAEPDLLRSLDGKIPGVQLSTPSGAAGSSTKVTIRGSSSFAGNNQPLYIVDGVPYGNNETATSNQTTGAGGAYGSGISTLDPNDIESMSVLKGAASAALYGSRAANGVIIIVTKSGSRGNKGAGKGLEVTLNASYTIEKITGLPDYQNKYGVGNNFNFSPDNGSWGPSFNDLTEVPLDKYANGAYGKAYSELAGIMVPYKAQKNNVKDLFDTGGIYDLSANIARYNADGHFTATLSKMDQDSYIPNAEFNRYSVSVGGNQKLMNGLRVGGNIAYSKTKQRGPMFGSNNVIASGNSQGASSFARALVLGRNWDMSLPYATPNGNPLFYVATTQAENPLWSWDYNKITTTMTRTVANFNAGYDITSDLSVDYILGMNDFAMDRNEIFNLGSKAYSGLGRIKEASYNSQEIESTLLVKYNKTVLDDFGVNVYLGHNVNQLQVKQKNAQGVNMITPGIYTLDNTESQTATSYSSTKRLWAVFGDLTLDYKKYAFLTVTGRNDFSSTLPKNNRSFFYPSVAGSFVFTEAFNINMEPLDYGKVRLSWAKVGNDASVYYTNGRYSIEGPYLNQNMLVANTTKYDENLKPEFTKEIEFGTELQFFKGRATVDFTYYNRNSTDMIAAQALPYSSGYYQYMTNLGKLNNKGIELGVTLKPVMTKDFEWDLAWNYSRNKSEVKELVDGLESIDMATGYANPTVRQVVGKPYGSIYGTAIARDEEGNMLINPSTGQYLRDPNLQYLGNPEPLYRTSLTNTFKYKGISLSFMFDAQVGGVMFTTYMSDLLGRGVTRDTENRLGARIMQGVWANPNNLQPILDGNGNKIQNTTQITEMDVWFSSSSKESAYAINSVDEMNTYDATTIRLRELSLGYDFPKKWLTNTFLGTVHVSFIARNLWHYAPNVPKYSNYDPTVGGSFGGGNIQGIDYGSAPNTKRYGFNLRATF